ncbi:hypothetical protein [Chryseobacterium sp.]|uniref:hypothetical protein n=1 Tax=Chryseobacterium sp. TaxID=1871047 RepID=UPI0011C7FE37|nr:hypothetical protein [Chryseobacterium sp.]TXF79043.1 hypothetical protein FUA25_01235 [Chryseobacterium sp.]
MQQSKYDKLVFEFATLFLAIYKVDEIKFIKFENNKLFGQIIWNDSDEDNEEVYFKWEVQLKTSQIINLIDLLKYIVDHNLYYSDIIKITEGELIEKFKNKGWKQIMIIDTLENLFNIEFERYENNENVGSFFVHL